MTPLDKSLETLRQDMENPQYLSQYYDLFLNSPLFVPVHDQQSAPEGTEEAIAEGHQVPLVMEADGNDYLMLFDTEERLTEWAGGETVPFVQVPGFVVAEMSEPPLHWALNVGTDFSKQFVPDEIAWLKDVVKRCNEAAGEDEESSAS